MKKILFLCLVAFCSCSQKENMDSMLDDVVKSVEVSIEPMDFEASSRLDVTSNLKYLWQLNDIIGIFPNKGSQVEFPVDESSVGTTKANFNGGAWGLKSGYVYSAYYPYNFYNRNAQSIPFSYKGQVVKGSDNREHLSDYTLMIANPAEVSNGALTFSLGNVGSIFKLTLTLPEAKTYKSIDLYADSEIIPVEKTFNILTSDKTESVTTYSNHLSYGLNNISTTAANKDVVLWLAFPSMSQPTKTLKAVVKDSQGYVYVADIIRNDGGAFYLDLGRNKGFMVKASPVLTDGFQGGIEDWVNDGNDYGGVAN